MSICMGNGEWEPDPREVVCKQDNESGKLTFPIYAPMVTACTWLHLSNGDFGHDHFYILNLIQFM